MLQVQQLAYLCSTNRLLLYILTSIWALHIPDTSRKLLFPVFLSFSKDFVAKMKKSVKQNSIFWAIPKCLLTQKRWSSTLETWLKICVTFNFELNMLFEMAAMPFPCNGLFFVVLIYLNLLQ